MSFDTMIMASLSQIELGKDSVYRISEQMGLKYFGATRAEMKNWTALQRLGVTYSEFEDGNSIHESNPTEVLGERKSERITGFSMGQMKRAKALAVLGTSEDEMCEIRAKRLGSIGRSHTS